MPLSLEVTPCLADVIKPVMQEAKRLHVHSVSELSELQLETGSELCSSRLCSSSAL